MFCVLNLYLAIEKNKNVTHRPPKKVKAGLVDFRPPE